jgi:hypothetical protein
MSNQQARKSTNPGMTMKNPGHEPAVQELSACPGDELDLSAAEETSAGRIVCRVRLVNRTVEAAAVRSQH